jgi:hypothetical protein
MVDKLRNILAPSCNDGLRERVCFFHGLRQINSGSTGFRRAFSTTTRPRLRTKSPDPDSNQPPARRNAGCLPAFFAGILVKQPIVAVFPMSLGDSAPEQIGSAPGQSHSALGQIRSAPGQTHSAPGEISSALGGSHFPLGESRSFPGENCAFWHTRHSPGGFINCHKGTEKGKYGKHYPVPGSCINQPGIAPNVPVYAVGTALQFRDGQTDLTAAKSNS